MSKLRLQQQEHIAILTLDNPPANTWTPESLGELKTIIEQLNQDQNNLALIIHSDSEKFFCAGADLNTCNHDDKQLATVFTQAFGDAFAALTNYRGVSIAAITGYAMGGGLETALCCDIRICETQAKMALPEASVGLLPCGMGTQHLPWLVGEGWAKRMILLGEQVDADTAQRIGLVQEIVATGKALDKAKELAALTAKQSPTAMQFCKQLIMQSRDNLDFAKERELFIKLWDDSNQLEGVSAFLEKRKPNWHYE